MYLSEGKEWHSCTHIILGLIHMKCVLLKEYSL